ncbi:MAG TPA: nucleotide exchange factor GrpE [Candidatus Polarisedimenticolia bacterium]|nr:nucleotide exchange factor GrpE [Candidatus Polarisedimenticolia bacterium]
MMDKDKRPEKIDMRDVLGPGAGAPESDEIEIVDDSRSPGPAAGAEGLKAVQSERDKYYDLWVRARADFENFRKRIERERDEERAQAGAALARDILPALDNLERALAGAPEGEPFRDGVALIHRQLRDALSRAGLVPIEALGDQFNPIYHEAVATERTARFEPNRILEEIQKGYLFRGRVLRPSLVKVAVKPEDPDGRDARAADEGTPGA